MAQNLTLKVDGQVLNLKTLTDSDIDKIKQKFTVKFENPESADTMEQGVFYSVPVQLAADLITKVSLSTTPVQDEDIDNREIVFFEDEGGLI